jgi:DnaJ-class molecular chaperone
MHAPNTPASRCPACDGFPVVAVTIGPRHPDGTLPTLPVTCPTCSGTGTRPVPQPARVLVAR